MSDRLLAFGYWAAHATAGGEKGRPATALFRYRHSPFHHHAYVLSFSHRLSQASTVSYHSMLSAGLSTQ
jgi:hypothetical protein